MHRARTFLVASILLFTSAMAGPEEHGFWTWFQENSDTLYHFERDQERIFDQLAERMHRVHPDLTFEFGPVLEDGTREFVISADGMKAAFPAVDSLFASAPKLSRWKWVKFRPRRSSLGDVEMSGHKLRVGDVRYHFYRDGPKLGIVLFVDGYREKQKEFYSQAGFLLLDEALGEYAMETEIGFIEVAPANDSKAEGARPIREIANHFDELRPAKVQ
jgi:hypothetical protein